MHNGEGFFRQIYTIFRRNPGWISRKIGEVWRKKNRHLGALTCFKQALGGLTGVGLQLGFCGMGRDGEHEKTAAHECRAHRNFVARTAIKTRQDWWNGKMVCADTGANHLSVPWPVLLVASAQADTPRSPLSVFVSGNG